MAKHLSSAIVKSKDIVARLKNVIVKPKYWHTGCPAGSIPTRVVF